MASVTYSLLPLVDGDEIGTVDVNGIGPTGATGNTGATGPNAVSNTTDVGTIDAPTVEAASAELVSVLLVQQTLEQGAPDRLRRTPWYIQAAVEATAAGSKTLLYKSGYKALFTTAKGAKTASGTATVSVQIDGVEVDTFDVTTTPTDVALASAPWPGVPVAVGETLSVVVSGTFTGLIFNLFGWRV